MPPVSECASCPRSLRFGFASLAFVLPGAAGCDRIIRHLVHWFDRYLFPSFPVAVPGSPPRSATRTDTRGDGLRSCPSSRLLPYTSPASPLFVSFFPLGAVSKIITIPTAIEILGVETRDPRVLRCRSHPLQHSVVKPSWQLWCKPFRNRTALRRSCRLARLPPQALLRTPLVLTCPVLTPCLQVPTVPEVALRPREARHQWLLTPSQARPVSYQSPNRAVPTV